MEKKRFRAVELAHLDDATIGELREWRNRDFVRQNMFQPHIISEEEHWRWIEGLKKDPNRYLFVFYLDEEPFAVVRFAYDTEGDFVETGDYLVSEEYQAMGYGTFVKYFTNEIIYNYFGYEKIHGYVLDINSRNLKTAKKVYTTVVKDDKPVDIDGEMHEIYIVDGDKTDWNESKKATIGKLVRSFVNEVEVTYTRR